MPLLLFSEVEILWGVGIRVFFLLLLYRGIYLRIFFFSVGFRAVGFVWEKYIFISYLRNICCYTLLLILSYNFLFVELIVKLYKVAFTIFSIWLMRNHWLLGMGLVHKGRLGFGGIGDDLRIWIKSCLETNRMDKIMQMSRKWKEFSKIQIFLDRSLKLWV